MTTPSIGDETERDLADFTLAITRATLLLHIDDDDLRATRRWALDHFAPDGTPHG